MPAGFLAGAALTPETITSDAGRMLVTFLGLVSASVLPTVSLLVNSMTASGRSVFGLEDLHVELQKAMDGLFLLFGCVAVVVIALVALATPPWHVLARVPYLTSEVLPRAGQAIVVLASTVTILRIGQIPAILRRSLTVRHAIAVEEARRKTKENAPAAGVGEAMFKTHPSFGAAVSIEDVGETPH